MKDLGIASSVCIDEVNSRLFLSTFIYEGKKMKIAVFNFDKDKMEFKEDRCMLMNGHSMLIDALIYIPEYNVLVSGGYDEKIIIWGFSGKKGKFLKFKELDNI